MNQDRREAIVRLLDTRYDWLPDIRSQWAGFGAIPGENPTRRHPCGVCDQTGRVTTRKGEQPCESCDGRGWFLVDAYTGKRERATATELMTGHEREQWRRYADAAIERLNQQIRPAPSEADLLAEANRRDYQWLEARKDMYRRFHYHELDRALEQLRQTYPGVSAHSSRGLAFLDARLPVPLRAPAPVEERRIVAKLERSAGDKARLARDTRILALAAGGLRPAEIAAECHVSIRTVYLVVKEAA